MGQVGEARSATRDTMCLTRTVWFLFFKLLLFQTLLVWCNARLISVNNNNFYNGGDFSDIYNNKKILSDPLLTNDVRSFILADLLTAARGLPAQGGAGSSGEGATETPQPAASESPQGGNSSDSNFPEAEILHRDQRSIEDELLGEYISKYVFISLCS